MKAPGEMNSGLFARGSATTNMDNKEAPTPSSTSLQTFATLLCAMNCSFVILDVSRAFLQSGNAAGSERYVVIAPEYIKFPRDGSISIETPRISWGQGCGLLIANPVYGLRASPPRWFPHLGTTLRKNGFRQGRLDLCNFHTGAPFGSLSFSGF